MVKSCNFGKEENYGEENEVDWISSYMIENLWRRLQSLDVVGIKDNWKIVCQNINFLIFQALKASFT